MRFTVLGISIGGNCTSVCHPHAGGGTYCCQQLRCAPRTLVEDLRIRSTKPERSERRDVWTFLRRDDTLLETHLMKRPGFLKPLQGCLLG